MEWIADLVPDRIDNLLGRSLAEVRAKVAERRRWVMAQFVGGDQVVSNPVFPGVLIGDSHGASKAVDPTQEWQTEGAASGSTKFLLQVTFLSAETAQTGIQ